MSKVVSEAMAANAKYADGFGDMAGIRSEIERLLAQ